MNAKKKYISPVYSPISLDETSSLVALSPPSDETGENIFAIGGRATETITPFTVQESSFGSSNGSPFDTDSMF